MDEPPLDDVDFIKKYLEYQSKFNLKNPNKKLKTLGSKNRSVFKFRTNLGGVALGVPVASNGMSIILPQDKGWHRAN